MPRLTVYHIPVCPFSQRLKILLALKGRSSDVEFSVVDITRPRDPELLQKSGGSTALPILDLGDDRVIKESLVILDYLDATIGETGLKREDPYERAVEGMLIAREGDFTMAGYLFVMNQDPEVRDTHCDKLLGLFRDLNRFLQEHNPGGTYLFDKFGLAETVFTPIFMRFWFLEYYEQFILPDGADYARVRPWRDACLACPEAQQVTQEEIVKLYYDYAMGAGNGALPKGRSVSSFTFDPDWRQRPWPPRQKYAGSASDKDLGLLPATA